LTKQFTQGEIMKTILSGVSLSLLVLVLMLVACNTMAGMGKDVERGGERVQDAAKPKQ
jgi:predicted small secreted protein